MDRCQTHGLLNCKCRESLAAYLAKQFRESGSGVDREQLGRNRDGMGTVVDRISRRGDVGGETKG